MITITLPERTELRLKDEARKRGVDASAYATEIIESALPDAEPNAATLEWIEQWERANKTDDASELARREQDCKDFMEGMNRNRLDMEGPNARKIYP